MTAAAPETAEEAETTDTGRAIRIGEVAELTGVTPRTIRYYEEIGLLGAGAERAQGKHRCYTQADVDRISEIVRLRDLLGLSLDQLSQLVEAEAARAALRKEYHATEDPESRQRILSQLLGHIENQLQLVTSRRSELEQLERELVDKQALVKRRLSEME
jgi:MerR family transcriptional regulator, repressor of the yfmOP operon